MVKETPGNNELSGIIKEALASEDKFIIPNGLVEKTISGVMERGLLKELIIELSIKIGIGVGSIAILGLVFFYFKGNEPFLNLLSYLLVYKELLVSVLLVVFVTILADQVILKYFTLINKRITLRT